MIKLTYAIIFALLSVTGFSQTIIWSEDFESAVNTNSGITTDQGDWITSGEDGEVWKHSFTESDGCWSESNTLPNFETVDNGFLMFDADAANCIDAMSDPPNSLGEELNGSIQSPSIDLSLIDGVALEFSSSHRLCCAFQGEISISVSLDGGATFSNNYNIENLNLNQLYDEVIRFNLTPLIGNESDVVIRWNFDFFKNYFWALDDIQLIELPDYDLVQSSISHRIGTDGLSYSIIPFSQASEITISSSLLNDGAQYIENAHSTVQVTNDETNEEVFSMETPQVNLSVVQELTVDFPSYTPSQTGSYSVSSQAILAGDGNLSNNEAFDSFRISDHLFARDNGQITGTFPEQEEYNGGYAISSLFEAPEGGVVHGVDVAFHSSTIVGEKIVIQLRDASASNFDVEHSSGNIIIEESDLNYDGEEGVIWKTILFDQPFEFSSEDELLVGVTYFGEEGVSICMDENQAPEQTVFIFGPFGIGNSTDWYFIRETPLIRLHIDGVDAIFGCMNESACNYNSEAGVDDGSCILIGGNCNDEYNSIIGFDCECQNELRGRVFVDTNFDGEFDLNEVGLPNQLVTIIGQAVQVYTDDNGEFRFTDLEIGTYQVEVTYTSDWTTYTTEVSLESEFPQLIENEVLFGVANDEIPAPSGIVSLYQEGAGIPCNDQLEYTFGYRNSTPYPISGVLKLELDELYSILDFGLTPDSIVDQTIYWSYSEIDSWVMNTIEMIIGTPSEEYIGDYVTNTVTLYVWVDDELVELDVQELSQEVTCAYDPNDITSIPEGYTEEHLVLEDTRMEYRIRFQNTGNAPAGNVLVVDTLDALMDEGTFEVVSNSHSVMTTLKPEGVVEFLFSEINLPDSTSNEAESHGFVSFKIDFKETVEAGDEINSTAYIYFDNNPPVVTNTAWNTIHECGGESAFESESDLYCQGQPVNFVPLSALVEEYEWSIDEETLSSEEQFVMSFPETGEYTIKFNAENPLCSEISSITIEVLPLVQAEITVDGDLLTASEGESYQWYLNGELIVGATDQEYSITESGDYSVEVIRDDSCLTISDAQTLVGVYEQLLSEEIRLYPNPMNNSTTIEFRNAGNRTVRILDATGKRVRSFEDVSNSSITFLRGDLASGNYMVMITSENTVSRINLIVR